MIRKVFVILKNAIIYILFIPVMAISLPIVIFSFPKFYRNNVPKRLKFLIKNGFSLENHNNNNIYFFKREKTVIKIIQDQKYLISFDNGENYINITSINIGSSLDKKLIEEALEKSKKMSNLEFRKGNGVDSLKYLIRFLRKNLNEL